MMSPGRLARRVQTLQRIVVFQRTWFLMLRFVDSFRWNLSDRMIVYDNIQSRRCGIWQLWQKK